MTWYTNSNVKSLKKFTTALFFLAACLFVSCGEAAPEWRHTGGAAWGTGYNVTYKANIDLADSVVAEMKMIEEAVSMFDPESNVSRINAGTTDTLSPICAEIFLRSKRLNALSYGAFDPTVAPLVKVWGFGPGNNGETAVEPDSSTLKWLLERVGIQECRIDVAGRIVRKHPRTEFDFSAIAKGYGVDRIGDMLRRNGCTDYMVEIGGEVTMAGRNERGELWHVQIDNPVKSGRDGHVRLALLETTNCSMATSGNYRNYRVLPDGHRVGHTISPITGRPVATNLLSVSVVAPSCMTADALATACMALSVPQATAMLRGQRGVSALLVVSDVGGAIDTLVVGDNIFGAK